MQMIKDILTSRAEMIVCYNSKETIYFSQY